MTFSTSNFEIMIPTDNANNSETELQSADKFNSIFRPDNTVHPQRMIHT
jgi:hypothetical protein